MKEKWEHDYTQGCPILKTEEPAHETIISSDITEHVLNVTVLTENPSVSVHDIGTIEKDSNVSTPDGNPSVSTTNEESESEMSEMLEGHKQVKFKTKSEIPKSITSFFLSFRMVPVLMIIVQTTI